MKLSKKNSVPQKAAAPKSNSTDGFLAAEDRQNNTDGVMEALGDLYQQINGHDKNSATETLPEDEVTLEEIIARGNMPDETFIIDYGSEDDVPPPSDADYLEFYEPTEILETVVNIDDADLDANFDSAGIPSKESVSQKRLNQDILPRQNDAALNNTTAASTTLTDEHDELLEHRPLLTPEEDELYEAWREAEPLPLLDPEDDEDFALLTDDIMAIAEPPISEATNPVRDHRDNITAMPDFAGARCMFCSHPLEAGGKACGNCGAPINPKRFFHDWAHAYAEPGASNPNLVPCRFCGRQVFRRVHVCPKCNNVLLKPVYTPEEIHKSSRSHLAKTTSTKQKSGGLKYLLLIFFDIAIAAVIIGKALLQTP